MGTDGGRKKVGRDIVLKGLFVASVFQRHRFFRRVHVEMSSFYVYIAIKCHIRKRGSVCNGATSDVRGVRCGKGNCPFPNLGDLPSKKQVHIPQVSRKKGKNKNHRLKNSRALRMGDVILPWMVPLLKSLDLPTVLWGQKNPTTRCMFGLLMTIGGIAEVLLQEEKAFLAKPENGS